jgi:thymidylate synthase
MPWKSIVTELLWFLQGNTNIKWLVDNGCNIWNGDAYKNYKLKAESSSTYSKMPEKEFIQWIKMDKAFAEEWGELGPIYGKQWRKWNSISDDDFDMRMSTYEVDQIQNLINDLKTNPDSRRLMVNAWNVGELDQMVLPPCHYGFQVYTRELSYSERYKIWFSNNYETGMEYYEGNIPDFDNSYYTPTPKRAISLMWNQRSVDTFLGLPFNIASYGLLLEIIAKEVNMVPEELIGNLGDVHLYSNHIEQAKEQIGRKYTHEERTELLKQAMGEENYNKVVDELMPFGGGLSEYYDSYKIPYTTREPYPLPTFDCPAMDEIPYNTFDELVFKLQPADFYMDDYESHPTIKAPLSN